MLEALEKLAREEARRLQHKYIRSEHLLLALLWLPDRNWPIRYEEAAEALSQLPYPTCGAEEKLVLAEGAKRAIAHAQALAGDSEVSAEQILAGIMAYSPIARNLFLKHKEAEKNQDE